MEPDDRHALFVDFVWLRKSWCGCKLPWCFETWILDGCLGDEMDGTGSNPGTRLGEEIAYTKERASLSGARVRKITVYRLQQCIRPEVTSSA